jgi:Icc-related predicted phosphoesterase
MFLACSGIDGRQDAIDKLEQLVRQRHPDAVLFAGGLFAPPAPQESPAAAAQRRHHDMRLLEQFFATLGAMRTVAAVIPGPHDAPLRAILMAGMNARSQSPGVHLVHCTLISARDVVISGVGGELTEVEDSGDPVIRCSRTTAQYFLQAFEKAGESEKVLLLGSVPKGALARAGQSGPVGNPVAADLIDTYHPKLCVVAGPSQTRGVEQVARTTIVQPGSLSTGSAAWIDWSKATQSQVEMFGE